MPIDASENIANFPRQNLNAQYPLSSVLYHFYSTSLMISICNNCEYEYSVYPKLNTTRPLLKMLTFDGHKVKYVLILH